MDEKVTVSISFRRGMLPGLEKRRIVATVDLDGLTPEEERVPVSVSVVNDGILFVDMDEEERHELIRLFNSLAESL